MTEQSESHERALLTPAEAASRLRVGAATVKRWARKGEIPAVKIGSQWRFDAGEIEQWIRDRAA